MDCILGGYQDCKSMSDDEDSGDQDSEMAHGDDLKKTDPKDNSKEITEK